MKGDKTKFNNKEQQDEEENYFPCSCIINFGS